MGRRWKTVYDREKKIGSIPSALKEHDMLRPDFDPEPKTLRIHRCGYASKCKTPNCQERATLIAYGAGRHVRQVELCPQHCEIVIERERLRGLEICDRRNE